MTIKLPVTADHNFIVDADQIPVAVAIQNPENGELDLSTAYARAADIVAALNAAATAPAPDLTALAEAARLALDWLGPIEASSPLTPGSGLSEDDRLLAARNVLRARLAAALALFPKDGTP